MKEDLPLHLRGALDIARSIRRGDLSATTYLNTLLTRAESVNASYGILVAQDANAPEAADAADKALRRGDAVGPLHGLSVTVKDSFNVRGMRTTSGAKVLKDHIADTDAPLVNAAKRAGCIIYGKSNLPEFAGDVQSYNELFGVTRNPWDSSLSAGGSSGGSAAAVAAGLSALEFGSDIAGSIRIPAACCGVVGHKPSYGIVPMQGHVPGMPGTLTQADLSVAGPFARTVDDAEFALRTIIGPQPWDAAAWKIELPAAPAGRKFRLATWLDDEACPIDSRIYQALRDAAALLENDGHSIDHDARPDFEFDYAWKVFERLLGAAESGSYKDAEIETRAHLLEANTPSATLGSNFSAMRHRAWLANNERRLQMRRKWRQFFSDHDAILMPVMPNFPIPHDHSEPPGDRTIAVNGSQRPYWDQIKWAGLTGVCWLPTTVIPVQVVDGLPVCIAVVSDYLQDLTALAVSRRLESLRGSWEFPSLY